MEIRLMVVRTADIKQLAAFYGMLGLGFEYHKHGNSPYHYSAHIGATVLEIYPLAKGQPEADKNFRFGLSIDNFDTTMIALKNAQVTFVSEPSATDFGFMAIVTDPDGRKIELYKKEPK